MIRNLFVLVMMESFYSSPKTEWVDQQHWSTKSAELEIFKYIEMFYNPVRLPESPGFVDPLDFKKKIEQTA